MSNNNATHDAQMQQSAHAASARKNKKHKSSKRRSSFSPDSTSQPALTARQKQKRRSIDKQHSRADRERQTYASQWSWGENASTSEPVPSTSSTKQHPDVQYIDLDDLDNEQPDSRDNRQDNREDARREQKHQQQQQRDKRKYAHRTGDGTLRAPNSSSRKKHGKNRNKPHPFDGFTPAELNGDDDSDDNGAEIVFARPPVRRDKGTALTQYSKPGSSIRKLVLRLPSSKSAVGDQAGQDVLATSDAATRRRRSTSSLSSVGSKSGQHRLGDTESDEENARFGDVDPSDISDGDSDSSSMTLSEDDVQSEDIEGEEERFLIADTLRELDEKLRNRAKSPGQTQDRVQPLSATQMEYDIQRILSPRRVRAPEIPRSAVADTKISMPNSDVPKIALTWSDGDASETNSLSEEERDANLDALLGLTQQDSAVILGRETWSSDDDRTMRFEDFLGEDDGDEISDADDNDSQGDEQAAPPGPQSSTVQGKQEDEHLRMDADVVSQGGFLFFRADSAEAEDNATVQGAEDRSGDTTDALDDTDHLGLVRFGIESADEDDEETEQALALARRDRSLVDASNLGLSLSIEELATNPEAVVAETARSLRIPPSVASRILASIGVTLLLGGGNEGTNTADLLDGSVSDADSTPNATTRLETPARGAKRTYEPTMGTFAPAGNVELCVVVAPQANQPVPSPFSARKRRRISHLLSGNTNRARRDSTSAASAVSVRSGYDGCSPDSSSPELVQCEIYLDLNDLVDDSELPIEQISSSEMDEDYDDGMSISTATAELVQALGDTSRWRSVPIGAFRSQRQELVSGLSRLTHRHPQQTSQGVDTLTLFPPAQGLHTMQTRRIPVSPVLLPMYRSSKSLKSVSSVKSRKDRRRERQIGQRRPLKPVGTRNVPRDRKPFSNPSQIDSVGFFTSSLPSDGLRTGASPLFPGLPSAMSTDLIPTFTLA